MKGAYYGSLVLVIAANLGYHLSSRSIPTGGNQFLGVGLAYIVSLFLCMLLMLFFKKESFAVEWKTTSKRYWLFGFCVPGLESGFILMYHHGWQVSQGALVADILTSALLAAIGVLVFHDKLGVRNIIGILLCFAGVIMAAL